MTEAMLTKLIGKRPLLPAAATLIMLQALSAWGEIVPASRRIDWDPGVRGGIPNRTTIYATLNPGDNIQTAINNCPAGQVVKLNAGTFTVTSGITINKGITLRGSGSRGAGATILNFNSASAYDLVKITSGGPWNSGSSVNITAGWTRGSTNLTLSSASSISVGGVIVMTGLNPSYVTPVGDNGTCSWCGYNDSARTMTQITKVLSKNGNDITIERPVYLADATSPRVFTAGSIAGAGVEDLVIYRSNSSAQNGQNLYFDTVNNCWASNVVSLNAGNSHIRLGRSYQCTVVSCMTSNAFDLGSDHGYGIFVWEPNSDHRIENNIVYRARHSLIFEGGGSGCVFGYNYAVGVLSAPDGNWLSGDMDTHGAHPYMNLFEGNIFGKLSLDNTWGSASHNTTFRCWVVNESSQTTKPTYARYGVDIQKNSYSNNVIGCIIGQPGDKGVRYQGSGQSGQCSYRLGFPYPSATTITDPAVASSTYIHGNYDFIGAGIVWDAGNADRALPNSLYLTSKPAWFGDRPWPSIDPNSPGAVSVTNLPAGYRYIYGVHPPTGPVNQSPVAVAVATPKSGVAPLTVNFSSAGSFDPEGTSLTYSWTFGDGGTSAVANPSRTYTTAGNYTARLTVSDGVNTVSSSNIAITVTAFGINQPPTAAANASVAGGVAPLTVNFSSAGSSDPEGTPLTYSWVFGDGTTSTAANPSHTYQTNGNFIAVLTVSDGTNSVPASPIAINVVNPGSGLVAAYGFEEGSGGTVSDASGNNNGGTITGATRTTQGRYGDALSFNGTDNIVVVNSSASLNLSSAMTLEAWVYPTASQSGWRTVLHRQTDAYYLHASSPDGAMMPAGGAIYNGSESYVAGPSAIPANTWTHLAVTYDGSMMRLYVNGSQIATKAQNGAIQTNSNPLRLGGNTWGQYFQGRIDEVRIYNRAISTAEVLADMNTPVTTAAVRPSPPTNLQILAGN